MQENYDHNQTLVPESFLALHARHGRALRPRAEIEARHDVCEDLALHTAAFLAARHQEGDDASDALRRCEAGLRASPSALPAAERLWVIRRVAELQAWPEPDWLVDLVAHPADDRVASDAEEATVASADRHRGRNVSPGSTDASASASDGASDGDGDIDSASDSDRQDNDRRNDARCAPAADRDTPPAHARSARA